MTFSKEIVANYPYTESINMPQLKKHQISESFEELIYVLFSARNISDLHY
jgi:hypothetical protein